MPILPKRNPLIRQASNSEEEEKINRFKTLVGFKRLHHILVAGQKEASVMFGSGPDMKYTLFEWKSKHFHMRIGVRMAWLILAVLALCLGTRPSVALPSTFAMIRLEPIKLDIPDDDIPRVIKALEHYYAYTVARQSTEDRYRELAEMLKKKQK